MAVGANLTDSWGNRTLANAYKCDDVDGLNKSMHYAGGISSPYNQSIRFPAPVFWMFWSNKTGSSSENVHVEIKCMKPDDLREGSDVPPDANQLLDGAQYSQNATNGSTGGNGGNGGGGGNGGNGKSGAVRMIAGSGGQAVLSVVSAGIIAAMVVL
jgi:hypothetical protein